MHPSTQGHVCISGASSLNTVVTDYELTAYGPLETVILLNDLHCLGASICHLSKNIGI